MLRSQLIPIAESNYSENAAVNSTRSPGVNVLVTEKHVPIVSERGIANTLTSTTSGSANSIGTTLPAFPALSKAHSTPASLRVEERIRKRSSSDEEDDSKAKQARVDECSVVIRPPNDRFGFKATTPLQSLHIV